MPNRIELAGLQIDAARRYLASTLGPTRMYVLVCTRSIATLCTPCGEYDQDLLLK